MHGAGSNHVQVRDNAGGTATSERASDGLNEATDFVNEASCLVRARVDGSAGVAGGAEPGDGRGRGRGGGVHRVVLVRRAGVGVRVHIELLSSLSGSVQRLLTGCCELVYL